MKEIILATGNSGKIRELQSILHPIIGIPQSDLQINEVEETGLSFIENAIIKARHASSLAQKPALADDSGLVVPALDGQPGIYSARYAGRDSSDMDNMQLLLSRMQGLEEEKRQAFFYCAIALVFGAEDPVPIIVTGQWSGFITKKPSGDQGFGYDPLFFVPTHNCTAAELKIDIKNTISHRALALQKLQRLWNDCHA